RVVDIGDRVAVGAGPDRDAVAEPELPRNAPVADVAHPAQVLLAPALGMESKFIVFRHPDGGPRQRFHLHPPLRRHHWFDDGATAVAMANRVVVGLEL